MTTSPCHVRAGAARFGLSERLALLSRSWISALVMSLLSIGALASCQSTPAAVPAARQ